MPDAESVFVDTNVLVYANVAESPFHDVALRALERLYEEGTDLWISRQVIREYLSVLTRVTMSGVAPSPARLVERVRFFSAHFRVADEDQRVTDRLLDLLQRYHIRGRQIHDANVVATMLALGVSSVLTANDKDFAQYSSLIRVMPLVRDAIG